MAWEKQLFDLPGMTTDVDLSGATGTTSGYNSTGQFLFAKYTAALTVEPCAALTDFPIGVIQTNPLWKTGYTNIGVEVRQLGITKITASGALTAGTIVGPNATGQAVARVVTSAGGDATHWVAGIILEASSAQGELATMLLLSPFILQA